jgi:hypothetical protein
MRPENSAVRAARLVALDKEIARMKTSPRYKRVVTMLTTITLATCFARPLSKARGRWNEQSSASFPSEPEAMTPVARAAAVMEQIALAQAMPHPLSVFDNSLPDDTKRAIAWLVESKDSAEAERKERFKLLRSASQDLSGWSSQLLALAPPFLKAWTSGAQPHVALIAAIAEAIGWPDPNLVTDLILGAPAVGSIPDSGIFRPDPQPASVDATAYPHDEWNRSLEQIVARSGQRPDPTEGVSPEALWQRTLKEVADGTALEIGDRAAVDSRFGKGKWHGMRRFGILQAETKICCCDNGKQSKTNAMTSLEERITCIGADWPVQVAGQFQRQMAGQPNGWSLPLGTEDLAQAYRRLPCADPGFTVFAIWDPNTARVRWFTTRGFSFGLKSAVVQFNRLSVFMARAATRLIPVVTSSYFDDFPIVDATWTRGGQMLLREFAALIGFPFSTKKSQEAAIAAKLLGVWISFARFRRAGVVTCSVTPKRVAELGANIDRILRGDAFPTDIGRDQLVGKLQFSLQWAAGRFGKAAIQPLVSSANGSGSSHQAGLHPAVRTALAFFAVLLASGLRPRQFCLRSADTPPILVWIDAAWEPTSDEPATIGFVICIPGDDTSEAQWLHGSGVVPDEYIAQFRKREQYIGQLEILGAVAVYYSLPELFVNKKVLHFIDNTSAVAGLLRGYSAVEDSARIVHAFWALATGLGLVAYFEYVKSSANVADAPSRGEYDTLHKLGSVERACLIPPAAAWVSTKEALDFGLLRSAQATPLARVSKRAHAAE